MMARRTRREGEGTYIAREWEWEEEGRKRAGEILLLPELAGGARRMSTMSSQKCRVDRGKVAS
jgi:hypothetical protein